MDILTSQQPLLLYAPEHGAETIAATGHPADSPAPVPSQETIADLAQTYWEQEGRPEGKADEHWRRAEAALRGSAG